MRFRKQAIVAAITWVLLFTNGWSDTNAEIDASVSGSIEIQAHIDGRDHLLLKGDTMQWHHFDFAAVGRERGSNSPTIVGGLSASPYTLILWLPVWPSPPPDEIRLEALSSVLSGVNPSIPSDGAPWQVEKVFGRGEVNITEQPNQANGFTLILEFDDNAFGGSAFYGVVLSKAPTDIGIDIKPMDNHNVINPWSPVFVRVAVLSDTVNSFDPVQIDIPTVRFGPDGATADRHRVKDVNEDGLGDLILGFWIPDTGIQCGDTEATLTGETFGGDSITGTDTVKTARCK